jgi:hypothetical protein
MPLFGPPNVSKLAAKGDLKGLIKALGYQRDWLVRRQAVEAVPLGRDRSDRPSAHLPEAS